MEANINPDWKFLKRIQKKFGNRHSLKILFYMVSRRDDDTYKYYTWLEKSSISNMPENWELEHNVIYKSIIYKKGVDFATNKSKSVISDGHYKTYKTDLETSLNLLNLFNMGEDIGEGF